MFNYAMVTPTLWNIGKEECVELGNIAWPMLEECMRVGKPIYKGSVFPDDRFDLNYENAKKALEEEDYSLPRHLFITAFHNKYSEICDVWREDNYTEMCLIVAREMERLAKEESEGDIKRYEDHKKEIEKLAEEFHAQQEAKEKE